MAKAPSANPEMIRRATEFIFHLREHYRAYHDHKDSMAALYVVAFGSALIMKDWPPTWGSATLTLTILAITTAWLGMLVYLKWQLRRRRWAALRVAGAEKLLAKWITEPPTEEDLRAGNRGTHPRATSDLSWMDHLRSPACPNRTGQWFRAVTGCAMQRHSAAG